MMQYGAFKTVVSVKWVEVDAGLYGRQSHDLVLLCHKSNLALTLPQQRHCPRRAIGT